MKNLLPVWITHPHLVLATNTLPSIEGDLATPQGRARLFQKRIDELTAPKPEGRTDEYGRRHQLSIDEAIFEMRTGSAEDRKLLTAMGA